MQDDHESRRKEPQSMADENDKPTLDPQPRRRVPPPTIDLEATDVSPPDAARNTAPDTDPPSGPAPSGSAASDAGVSAGEPGAKSAEPRPRETKVPPDWAAGTGSSARASVLAGAVGAALALAVAGGAWFWLGGGPDGTAEMNARLARAEAQLAAQTQPSAAADPKALADLTRRVAALESARAAAPADALPQDNAALADLARRLDAVAASARAAQEHADAAKTLAEKAAADAARPAAPSDAAPPAERADLDALGARVGKLEGADKALADRLAKAQTDLDAKIASQSVAATAAAATAAAAPAAVRDATAALALELAVERGAPYAHELAAVDPADPHAREALQPFAATGVPSAYALSRELAALLPAARAAVQPTSDAGLLDRLGVHVRPIGTPAGDAPPEVLARLETAAGQGDLAAARADAAKLPDAARAALDPWSKRAAAREAAVGAAAALVAKALDALHGPQGAPTR
jgi:hypothetical protein